MLSRLKTLFKRENKLDPLAAQRERLMEISRRETCESPRHGGPHAIDINGLLTGLRPDCKPAYIGAGKGAPPAGLLSWLRAEPNTWPEKTPMTFRVFHITLPPGPKAQPHAVMVSNGELTRTDIQTLFVKWEAESQRLRLLPPPAENPPAP